MRDIRFDAVSGAFASQYACSFDAAFSESKGGAFLEATNDPFLVGSWGYIWRIEAGEYVSSKKSILVNRSAREGRISPAG